MKLEKRIRLEDFTDEHGVRAWVCLDRNERKKPRPGNRMTHREEESILIVLHRLAHDLPHILNTAERAHSLELKNAELARRIEELETAQAQAIE